MTRRFLAEIVTIQGVLDMSEMVPPLRDKYMADSRIMQNVKILCNSNSLILLNIIPAKINSQPNFQNFVYCILYIAY